MEFTNVSTVVAIVIICYLLGIGLKATDKFPDKYIPVAVGVLGGLIGAFAMNVMPNYPADNVIDAIAVGIASGLSATGINQLIKQVQKNE